MSYGRLQDVFADIVIDGNCWLAQKESQLFPVIQFILDGRTQSAIRFHLFVFDLLFHPEFETIHERAAMFLMVEESLLRRQLLLNRIRFVPYSAIELMGMTL